MKIKPIKIIEKPEGQSLVEVVVAMAIMMFFISAAMYLVVTSKNLLYQSENTTKATALAQEGIEIIRSNRNIGCDFNSLGKDTYSNCGSNCSMCHAIESDTVDPSDSKNTSNKIIPYTTGYGGRCFDEIYGSSMEKANHIDNFSGFTRHIFLYDLSDITAWNPGDFGNGTSNSFDDKNKYYYVKVRVSWIEKNVGKSTEISTIMLKRWKDF